MRLPSLHPDLATLERLAQDVSHGASHRTAAHLARCAKCRSAVLLIRALSQQRPESPGRPDPMLLSRIQASRASGTRVLLPVSNPTSFRVRQVPRLIAAAAVATAIGLAALLNTREATAGSWSGELWLNPAAPRSGDTVRIVYRPAESLADESVLRLRARFRVPGDDWYWFIPVQQITLLERQRDGTFTGTFILPDSVVFAALAVDDAAAERVDSNDGRTWELLVHGPDGEPLEAALDQRIAGLIGRSFEEAHATVVRMTRLYPDSYSAWELRSLLDGWLHPESADSVRAIYSDTVAHLVAKMRASSTLALTDLERLTYRSYFKDTTSYAYWRERLQRADPRNQQLQQLSTIELALLYGSNPTRLLSSLDSLWEAIGPAWGAGRLMVVQAIHAARDANDPELIRLWADRLRVLERRSDDPTVHIFLAQPALRGEGIRRLRVELTRLAAARESERGLGETARNYGFRRDVARRRLLADLGIALLEEGHVDAGLDTITIAVERGWNRGLFRRAADARLSRGDTLGALRMYALVVADPRSTRPTADSLLSLARESIGANKWDVLLRQASAELAWRVLEGADPTPLRRKARIADRDGRIHSIADLSAGEVTLVVFWSRFCGPAIAELPVVDSVAARLRQRGVRIVSITDELPSTALDRFIREKGISMPVFYDTRGEAMDAFNNHGKPAYYVMDSSGRIRFRYANPVDDLILQAEALLIQ